MELVKGTVDEREVLNYVLPLCKACNDMRVKTYHKPNEEHIYKYSFLNGNLVIYANRVMQPDGSYIHLYLIYT